PMHAVFGEEKNNWATYQLVVPDNANKIELEAAEQFRQQLLLMSDFNLPIVKENEYGSESAFFIGNTRKAHIETEALKLEQDSILIKPEGQNLILAGGGELGV
ncbi:hypothetical protein MD537_23370, partial [Flavihumibacter sediminis]|nr:hypothetical protein [Flavihumibacter sediminis]